MPHCVNGYYAPSATVTFHSYLANILTVGLC